MNRRTMRFALLIVVQVLTTQLAVCEGNGGGPSTFGYDASSACSKPYSRAGRARLANLPCDFRRQNWCTVAGSAYPWHAVRRFVQENQGLMRRMYGDESHINILKAEFEKNDIELRYDEYQQYSDDARRFQYLDDYEYNNDKTSFKHRDYGRSHDPASRSGKRPKLGEYSRPHFRPSASATLSSNSGTTKKANSDSSTDRTNPTTSTTTNTPDRIENEPSTSTSSTAVNNPTGFLTDSPDFVATRLVEQNSSINEIPGQIDRIDEDIDDIVYIEIDETTLGNSEPTTLVTPSSTYFATMTTATTTTPPTTTTTTTTSTTTTTTAASTSTSTSTLRTTASTSTEEPQNNDDLEELHEFRPRPEFVPSSTLTEKNPSVMEGQLYQDVAAKDEQEQPVLKLRGVNACPVKEEVVAPFWANNTRGEVLALLNLYPFEQYVHWEKCTHENKQMYCRDGCRCEQQYRLHRLLAYDPNNECRGIFSDWFKFPSCCVCRCYDLPLEFRVTSRSPRTQKQRIKVHPPQSRYA